MKVIVPSAAKHILEEQEVQAEHDYRFLTFCAEEEIPEGRLLYNVMTKELLFLTKEESAEEDPVREYLIKNWFLVPKEHDDRKLALELREVARLLHGHQEIKSYTILTTTECNARCFYCYEAEYKKVTMSRELAAQTAEYIKKTASAKGIGIHWFGGEPLYNMQVIDLISEELQKTGTEYKSDMISNGYLFDADVIQRAVELWHLNFVQISLDGTESVYNSRKAYIYHEGNPYRRVLKNIGWLLESGIAVDVRLNLDFSNYDDLFVLCQELVAGFGAYEKFSIYPALLYSITKEENREAWEKREKLLNYLERQGIRREPKLKHSITINQCMADSDESIVISPMGELGKCEHFYDTPKCGTIHEGITGKNVVSKWKEFFPDLEECTDCELYPNCVRLKGCPVTQDKCIPEIRERRKKRMKEAMLSVYRRDISEKTDTV